MMGAPLPKAAIRLSRMKGCTTNELLPGLITSSRRVARGKGVALQGDMLLRY